MNIIVKILDVLQKQQDKVKIEKILFWYDSENQEMLTFKGGTLDLTNKVWDEKLQRCIPKIIDISIPIAKMSRSRAKVENWFKGYSNYNNTRAEIIDHDSDGILVSVPQEEMDDFSYALSRNDIRFEVE